MNLQKYFILFILLLLSLPVLSNEELCLIDPSENRKELNKISCKTLMESDLCRVIPPKEKRACHDGENIFTQNLSQSLEGCVKGLFRSGKEFLLFIEEALKFLWQTVSSSSSRKATMEKNKEFASTVKLYLYTLYDEEYEKAEAPKAVNAAAGVSKNLTSTIIKAVVENVEHHYNQFHCLNVKTRTDKICKVLADLIIPPAAFFSALRKGKNLSRPIVQMSKAKVLTPLKDAAAARQLAVMALKNGDSINTLISKTKFLKAFTIKGKCDSLCAFKKYSFLQDLAKGKLIQHKRVIDGLVNDKVLFRNARDMAKELKSRGFREISTCVKKAGKCIILPDGREAPMKIYVHETGVAVRLKPERIRGEVREWPHASLMITEPNKNYSTSFKRIKSKEDSLRFSDDYLGWDQELTKIDPRSGKLLPKSPALMNTERLETPEAVNAYADVIMNQAHPYLQD